VRHQRGPAVEIAICPDIVIRLGGQLLDRTPEGHDNAAHADWPRRHDEYERGMGRITIGMA
jgi:hypothetical protein